MYSACLLLLGEKDDGTPHAAKETNQAVPNHIGQDPVRFCPGCPVEAKSNFLPVGLNCKFFYTCWEKSFSATKMVRIAMVFWYLRTIELS